jgi:hypothetical protein
MKEAYVTAFAALAGAALGGFNSFVTSWTTLRAQTKAQQSANSKSKRQDLYKRFIEEASGIYGSALIHNTLELSGLISLYALICEMRALSSPTVIENAARVVQTITEAYSQPNKSPAELEAMIHNGGIDLLHDFSNACRKEFELKHPL